MPLRTSLTGERVRMIVPLFSRCLRTAVRIFLHFSRAHSVPTALKGSPTCWRSSLPAILLTSGVTPLRQPWQIISSPRRLTRIRGHSGTGLILAVVEVIAPRLRTGTGRWSLIHKTISRTTSRVFPTHSLFLPSQPPRSCWILLVRLTPETEWKSGCPRRPR